jgi:hypothetical protein
MKNEDTIQPSEKSMDDPAHLGNSLVIGAIANENRSEQNTEHECEECALDDSRGSRDKDTPEPKCKANIRNVIFHRCLLRPTVLLTLK